MTLGRTTSRILTMIVTYIGLILLSIFALVPILWMISSSVKLPTEIHAIPPHWLPKTPTFDNYLNVLRDPDMLLYFSNSMVISTATIKISV